VFGPSGTGKTVLLCEIAGEIQKAGGNIQYHDPEARLNKDFAKLFNLHINEEDYFIPNTIPEVFNSVRSWDPGSGKINGVLADSLAALSTNLEMDNEDGDKMGMRRAKEFSEELRKTARILPQNNLLMVCSNQVRVNVDAGPYGQKFSAPGGTAIGFYASLRLRIRGVSKIYRKEKVKGKEVKRVIGITVEVIVEKSSIDKPHREASVSILFDYGIDDIRENLKFVKKYTGATTYVLNGEKLAASLEKAIQIIEEDEQEEELRKEVIDLWNEIEEKFESDRKKKRR